MPQTLDQYWLTRVLMIFFGLSLVFTWHIIIKNIHWLG